MTWPTKTDFVDGDVLTATQVNNIGTNLNVFDPTSATIGQVPVADGAGSAAWGAVASGLTLITTVTVTSGSTVNVDNVFDATYDNYVVLTNFTNSSNAVCRWNFRYGGTSYTSSSSTQMVTFDATSATISRTAQTYGYLSDNGPAIVTHYIYVSWPYTSGKKARYVMHNTFESTTNLPAISIAGYTPNTTIQMDGFAITLSTGSLNGQISVYGVAK